MRWGMDDPLWAIAAEPERKRGERCAWTDEEFYSSGEADWRDFLPRWLQYGVDTGNCLEIGCGVGRITKQLALLFEKVYAIDVSPAMIARAGDAIVSGNVEFFVTGGLALPQADGSVKAIFSTHVLQHLDSAQIVSLYFTEFFRVLEPGGTIMIHVPLYEWPGAGRIATLLEMVHAILLRISNVLAWTKRRAHIKTMRGTACHARSLYSSLAGVGFKDIEFRTFATSRNNLLHSFVMARK